MKLVVALGGNALGNTPEEQKMLVKSTAKAIVDLIEQGHSVVVTHGNGPQVGMINLAFETASKSSENVPAMPFPECGAMSQGYIGYHLQTALQTELKNRNISKPVAAVVTQVVVDKNDKGFTNPTKPIGAYCDKAKAEKQEKESGYVMRDFGAKGFRRVVASPLPVDIVEIGAVKTLLNNDCVVITVGGGGIPVVKEGNEYEGVPAVIDKDFASALVAKLIDADELVILTAVDKVAVDFGKPTQKDLDILTVSEAEKYMNEDQFGKGSMQPKVTAAVNFVKSGKGKQAIIANLEKAELAIKGKSGTKVING
ncbi:MAG TPA: carbamate kinase [Eubacteriales bacterium]|nr:carbamate kinase [Eubacteriales bacterium]